MSLIDHVHACNTFRPERFLPLRRGGMRLGWVRHDNAAALRRFPRVFAVSDQAVELIVEGDFDTLTASVDDTVEALVEEGRVEKWRHEYLAVAPRWGAPPVFKLDRGAVPFFGTRSYGVHLNGWRSGPAGLELWIGRRAYDKRVSPGKLDNLVAGGIGFGHGVADTLAKEAGEEAAIPPTLIVRAVAIGAIAYRLEMPQGMRDDTLFVYDLEVPADFVPRNTDGEIAEFMVMPTGEVMARLRTTADFKFNVNLVLIDFAVRNGLIDATEPDYLDLVAGLRRAPD